MVTNKFGAFVNTRDRYLNTCPKNEATQIRKQKEIPSNNQFARSVRSGRALRLKSKLRTCNSNPATST